MIDEGIQRRIGERSLIEQALHSEKRSPGHLQDGAAGVLTATGGATRPIEAREHFAQDGDTPAMRDLATVKLDVPATKRIDAEVKITPSERPQVADRPKMDRQAVDEHGGKQSHGAIIEALLAGERIYEQMVSITSLSPEG